MTRRAARGGTWHAAGGVSRVLCGTPDSQPKDLRDWAHLGVVLKVFMPARCDRFTHKEK